MTTNYFSSLHPSQPKRAVLKLSFFGTVLADYLQFVKLLGRGKPKTLDESVYSLPYFAYTKIRGKDIMEVSCYYNDEGKNLQEVVEQFFVDYWLNNY